MSAIVACETKLVLNTTTTFLDFFEDFLENDVGDGSAATDTLKTYRCHIKQFLSWCSNTKLNPIEATFNQLKKFRHWLVEDREYQHATISLKLTILRRFYDGLREYGYVINNPALRLKPPTQVKDPAASVNYLESEEMYRLLDSLPQDNGVPGLRDRLMISVMVLQGLRTVEIHRVNVGNIIRNEGNVGLRVSSKRHTRVVPLTPDLANLLRRYLMARRREGETITDATPLFISVAHTSKGNRISRRSIRRIVDKYLHSVGLKELPTKAQQKNKRLTDKNKTNLGTKSPPKASKKSRYQPKPRKLSAHSLRHTTGTLAVRAGASLQQIQYLLGHVDLKTTQIYAHIADIWQFNPGLLLLKKPQFDATINHQIQRLQQSLKRINPLNLTLNEEEMLRILDKICA